jgi:hypothetical protein
MIVAWIILIELGKILEIWRWNLDVTFFLHCTIDNCTNKNGSTTRNLVWQPCKREWSVLPSINLRYIDAAAVLQVDIEYFEGFVCLKSTRDVAQHKVVVAASGSLAEVRQ